MLLLLNECHYLKFKTASTGLMHSLSSSFKWMNFKGSQAPGLKSHIIIWDLNLLQQHTSGVLTTILSVWSLKKKLLCFQWGICGIDTSFLSCAIYCTFGIWTWALQSNTGGEKKVNKWPESERIKNSLVAVLIFAEDDQGRDGKEGKHKGRWLWQAV